MNDNSVTAYANWIELNGFKDNKMRNLAFEYGWRLATTKAKKDMQYLIDAVEFARLNKPGAENYQRLTAALEKLKGN